MNTNGFEYLQQHLGQLYCTLDLVSESVVITDRSSKIEYVNSAFTKTTGYTWDEVIGKTPSLLSSTAQPPSFYVQLWETISSNRIWKGTLVDKHKDGSYYPAEMTIIPYQNDNGEITHYIGLQRDLTEQHALEEQFFQAQKMGALGALMGGVVHDFNNMLSAILGNAYLAKRGLFDNPALLNRLKNIEQLSHNAADMTKRVLSFTREDKTQMVTLSLNTFMKDSFKLVKNSIPENIMLTYNPYEEELLIKGDAVQLQQALINLLNNASHAVKESKNPFVMCSLTKCESSSPQIQQHPVLKGRSWACITVSDNGYGIREEHLTVIFKSFFTTKSDDNGTGLGLAMVNTSIQNHGGIIEVTSSPQEGTEFQIFLPIDGDAEESDATQQKKSIRPGQQETILLVDDDETSRYVTSEVLRSIGYTIIEATDGLQALEIFQKISSNIDVIISDVVMPRMNGNDAISHMRKINPLLPVILMTSYNDVEVATLLSDEEKENLLRKPVSFEDLSHKLRSLLEDETLKKEKTTTKS